MARFKDLAEALSTSVCIVALATPAQAQDRQYNVPAGSLRDALDAYTAQSGTQLIYRPEDLGNAKSKGINGSMPARAALDKLLAGSDFKAVTDTSGALAIVGNAAAGALNAGTETASSSGEVAASDQSGISEILVIGSRSQNVDIRRTENDVQPYVVFDSKEIQNSGALSAEDFLRQRLPMNVAEGLGSEQQQNFAAGQAAGALNLRGLGTEQTLVLVDGRRLPGVSISGSGGDDGRINQGSVRGIPVSSIERIEILPATASGIYGGNATGGVVNIILKRNYRGVDFAISYGNTSRFDANLVQANVNGGVAFENGRTKVSFSASHSQGGKLTSLERDFARRSLQLQLDGPLPAQVPSALVGATSTIVSSTGANLTFRSIYGGASLGSPYTYIPDGYAGPAIDGVAGLVANAGKSNATGLRTTLWTTPNVDTISLGVRRSFLDNLDVYIDLSADRSKSIYVRPVQFVSTLPGNSGLNPFQQAIRVGVQLPGLKDVSNSSSRNIRLTGGAILRLPHNWSSTLEYSWSKSESEYLGRIGRSATIAGRPTLRALALTDLRDVPVDQIEALLFDNYNETLGATNTLGDLSLRIGGPIVNLPGGPLNISGLLELQQNESHGAHGSSRSEVSSFYQKSFPASQDTTSGYLEIRAPVVGSKNHIPFVHELELSAAVRHDRYKQVYAGIGFTLDPSEAFPPPDYSFSRSQSTDYTVGGRFAPVRGLAFRASYGTGYKPVSLLQIVGTTVDIRPIEDFVIFTDPRRGGEALIGDQNGLLTTLNGGNPNLRPETSTSLSYGVILTPPFLPGLRISADVVQTRKFNEVAFVNVGDVLNHESELPGRVIRGPNLPGDPSGYPGPVTSVDTTLVNLFSSKLRSLDINADYNFETSKFGDFRFYAVATHALKLSRQVDASGTSVEYVDAINGPLRWSGNAGIDWSRGALSLSWNAQYYNGYNLCRADLAATSCDTQLANQGSRRVPSQIYHDLFISYKLDRGAPAWLTRTELAFSVQNLFDKEPPILAPLISTGGYSFYGDPRLRRFQLTLRKHIG